MSEARMKEQLLRRLHRYVGIVIAPYLVIQTVSGLLLGFGFFRRPGSAMSERSALILPGSWDDFLVKAHFEAGWAGDVYHLLLGAGIVWMALSGWAIYLQGRRREKSPPP